MNGHTQLSRKLHYGHEKAPSGIQPACLKMGSAVRWAAETESGVHSVRWAAERERVDSVRWAAENIYFTMVIAVLDNEANPWNRG